MNTSTAPATPILRLPDVEAMTGRKRSSIYEDIAAGRLPRPIKIGPRSVGWLRSEIEQWQASAVATREAERDARGSVTGTGAVRGVQRD